MEYNYENKPLNEIIGKYEISNDVITVTYLDKSQQTYPNTNAREQMIINKMFNQAIERNNSNESKKQLERNHKLAYVGRIGAIAFVTGAVVLDKFTSLNFEYTNCLAVLGAGALSIGMPSYINSYNRYTELKKYKLFLEMPDKFASLEPNPIGINNIDNYSLEEIENLYKNFIKEEPKKLIR